MDVQSLVAQARDALSVERVFGTPYEKDGIAVVPVASHGNGETRRPHHVAPSPDQPFPRSAAAPPLRSLVGR